MTTVDFANGCTGIKIKGQGKVWQSYCKPKADLIPGEVLRAEMLRGTLSQA